MKNIVPNDVVEKLRRRLKNKINRLQPFSEEEELFWDLLYYEVQAKLTQIEWIILHHYFHYGETLQEIAGHSPYTLCQLHYWKKKCLFHLQEFYQKEKVGD